MTLKMNLATRNNAHVQSEKYGSSTLARNKYEAYIATKQNEENYDDLEVAETKAILCGLTLAKKTGSNENHYGK